MSSLKPGEFQYIYREAGKPRIERITDHSFEGWRADQILTSPVFDLPTTMSPKVEVEVAKYTELLGKTKKTAEEAATFAKLSEWMRGTIPVAAETAAEREAFALVEDALLEVIRTRPVSERRADPEYDAEALGWGPADVAMRWVEWNPDMLSHEDREKWDAWVARAERARAQAVAEASQGRTPVLKSEIWTWLKTFFLEKVFHGRCSYCEAQVSAGFFGDAEHYRPKGKVTRGGAGDATDEVHVNGTPHPGYFWLAYDWRNLLPSCQKCNEAGGKMCQFPVSEGAWRVDFSADPMRLMLTKILFFCIRSVALDRLNISSSAREERLFLATAACAGWRQSASMPSTVPISGHTVRRPRTLHRLCF